MSVKTDRQTKDKQTDGGSTDKRRFRWNDERERKKENQCAVSCWSNTKRITAVDDEIKDQFARLSDGR